MRSRVTSSRVRWNPGRWNASSSSPCVRPAPLGARETPSSSLLFELERRHEGLLGNLHATEVLHPLLAFFLFFEQFALTRDVTAVTLSQHVLTTRLHRLAGHDSSADGRLNRDVEHLTRNEFFQALGHLSPIHLGVRTVHDRGKGVDRFVVDQEVDSHYLAGQVARGLVVERGVALGATL